jgi:hypothetical protein
MSKEVETFDFSAPKADSPKFDLSKVEVNYNDDVPDPIGLLFLGAFLVLSRGNISAVKGKAKARKSFFVAWLIAKVLSDSPDSVVLLTDTEQSKSFVYKVLKRVYRLMGWTKQNSRLKVLSLREFDVLDRQAIFIQAVETYKPDLAVLDGGVDIIQDFNNADESKQVVGLLMRLSTEHDMHIVNVLHEGKSNGELRGHFGAEMLNKSETVFEVVKDGEVSLVSPYATRNPAFEEFSFSVNEHGLPVVCDSLVRMTKQEMSFENSKRFITRILAPDKQMNNSDLSDAYMELNMCTLKTAQNHIKKLFLSGFIAKDDKSKLYRLAKVDDE